jgi:hypothetical protein
VITLCLASLSYIFIERPFKKPSLGFSIFSVRSVIAICLLCLVFTTSFWSHLYLTNEVPKQVAPNLKQHDVLFDPSGHVKASLFLDVKDMPLYLLSADNSIFVLDKGLNPPPFTVTKALQGEFCCLVFWCKSNSFVGSKWDKTQKILLWGDSFAFMYFGLFREILGEGIFVTASHAGCTPTGPLDYK